MSRKAIATKRIYNDPATNDGYRVLVDRLWPRGVSKEDAQLNEWMKEIAPTDELRKWFDHDPDKFEEFKKRYKKELKNHSHKLDELAEKSSEEKVTLLYGAKDKEHNHAIVLASVCKERINNM